MKPKDKVIIYIAGKGNRYFYAHFEILDKVREHAVVYNSAKERDALSMFNLACSIRVIDIWQNRVYIEFVKENLNFISDKKNYGLFFRQSTKVISEDDYRLIVGAAQEKRVRDRGPVINMEKV